MIRRKPNIKLTKYSDNLIIKATKGPFKKKSMIDIPKGYEVVLIEANGTSEIIRNVHQYKLDRNVHAIFYAKTNALVQSTKWGTRNRISITTQEGTESLGANGTLSFTLANPLRYINKLMHSEEDVSPEKIKTMVLDKVTDTFSEALGTKTWDDTNKNDLMKTLKTEVQERLAQYFDNFGINIDAFIIENITITNLT